MKHEDALGAILARNKAKPAGTPPSFAGVWQNEYQSTANFTVAGASVSGTYTSMVSGTGGTISGSITGWVSGDTIAFTVNWPTINPSMTTWVGQIIIGPSSQPILETLWYLVTDISEDPTQVWQSVLAGADVFTPAPISSHP